MKQITNEEFDRRLEKKVVENASVLLTIPGVYEAVSEFFNNDILEDWESEED